MTSKISASQKKIGIEANKEAQIFLSFLKERETQDINLVPPTSTVFSNCGYVNIVRREV